MDDILKQHKLKILIILSTTTYIIILTNIIVFLFEIHMH